MSESIVNPVSKLASATVSKEALPIVINTRPVERAAPLTAYLQVAGYSVLEMPMLSLQPREVLDADITIMRHWLTGHYKALVIVSPTAAESGLAVWQTLAKDPDFKMESSVYNPSNSAIIAVGDATAAVLRAANIPVLQPLIANNEGMLAMPEIERLQRGDKLLIWRGLGGRRLLVDTLQKRGVYIDSIAWYERTMPTSAANNYVKWSQIYVANSTNFSEQQSKPIVIISSGTAFEHWITVVQQAQIINKNDSKVTDTVSNKSALRLADFSYVVLGVRLAEMVASQQLEYWQVEDLAPETILAAIDTQPFIPLD